MKTIIILLITPLILLFCSNLYSQQHYYFKYQIVSQDNSDELVYEYHEWTPTEHLAMIVDSSLYDSAEIVEYDEKGFPVRVFRGISLSEMNTVMPLYKNKEEGYILRTVGHPRDFFSNPQVVTIREDFFDFDWVIKEERKEIGGKLCIKATTEFRCSKFTAWFAPEITLSSGPAIFHGLPGLIVRLERDNKGGVYELREFGSLSKRQLDPDLLGFNAEERESLKTHCDLEAEFNEYIKILKARAGGPDCRNCPMRIDEVSWHECWDDCK